MIASRTLFIIALAGAGAVMAGVHPAVERCRAIASSAARIACLEAALNAVQGATADATAQQPTGPVGDASVAASGMPGQAPLAGGAPETAYARDPVGDAPAATPERPGQAPLAGGAPETSYEREPAGYSYPEPPGATSEAPANATDPGAETGTGVMPAVVAKGSPEPEASVPAPPIRKSSSTVNAATLVGSPAPATADEPATRHAAPPAQGVTGIGAEQVEARRREAAPGDDARADTGLRVAGYATVPYQRLQVTLENGQVWRQIEGDVQRLRVDLRRNQTVDIVAAPISGYRMRLNELNRTIRVERIR